MIRSHIFFLLSVLLVPASATEVYRCVDAQGRVSFQQLACNGTGSRVESGEAQAVWDGLRQGEKALYQAYRQRDAKRLRVRAGKRQKTHGVGKRSLESVSCYNKRHALEETEAQLRSGYKAGEGARLHRRQAYLSGYLARYCRSR